MVVFGKFLSDAVISLQGICFLHMFCRVLTVENTNVQSAQLKRLKSERHAGTTIQIRESILLLTPLFLVVANNAPWLVAVVFASSIWRAAIAALAGAAMVPVAAESDVRRASIR